MKFDHITPQWLEAKLTQHKHTLPDKLTQKKLAQDLGVGQNIISRWLALKAPIGSTSRALLHYYFLWLEK
jgi:hypothetical protein